MNTRILTAAALAVVLAASAHAVAQEGSVALPAICITNSAASDMSSMDSGHDMQMDEAHSDLMMGMDDMNAKMMQGMTAEDIDVAFVCGMIPHHQGAINMAKAELTHGDDQWAKEMAQKVITAQEAEIADMVAWLEQQGK